MRAFVGAALFVLSAMFFAGCTPLQGPGPSSGGSLLPTAPSPVAPAVPPEGVPKFRLFTERK